jgi:hypothetical protein
MQEKIYFHSDGLKLAGIEHRPDALRPGERRPAFLVLHGFGGVEIDPATWMQLRQLAERSGIACPTEKDR